MTNDKNRGVHVTPRDDGRWNVSREGAGRASSIHETQVEAIEAGRTTARRKETELFIHGRDGRIRDRNSYGSDPYPPEG